MQRYSFSLLFTLFFSFFLPLVAYGESSSILTLEKNGEIASLLSPNVPSIGSITLGDLGTDGTSEILVATGYGTPTEIVVLRKDGSEIGSFSPYHPSFSGGASVAVCDLNGDGVNEIITGAGFGGGPHVRVFTHDGSPTGVQFFAYNEAFRGGVSLLCRDLTDDGVPEIITAPGPSGGPHLRVFSAKGNLEHELMISDLSLHAGLSLFMFPQNDTNTLLVTSASFTTEPRIAEIVFENNKLTVASIIQSDISPSKPISLSTLDGQTLHYEESLLTATENNNGSFFRLTAIPTTALSSNTSPKYIHIDISTQTLTAYEHGIPAFSFLISSGVATHPTPLGKTEVTAKLPVHDYIWSYGENHPANYALKGVLWNLRFRKHYYIHSAYWHNNFGHPMSHGCVNVSLANAEKIYAWAEVGTIVEIVE